MSAAPTTGATPYERWVLTLRAWQNDPTVSLDALPRLADDTFTPDTYRRLVTHITAALDSVGKRWEEGVGRALREFTTPFDLGKDLVAMRALLARQWQLADHSALPDGLRGPLSDGVRRRAANTQRDLEDSIKQRISGSTTDRAGWEQTLRALRESSLTRITQYAVGPDGRMTVAFHIPDPPASAPESRQTRPGGRFAHRRLFEE